MSNSLKNLAIVGSRTFTDYKKMKEFINEKFDISEVGTIVSGGARGADSLARVFAFENDLELLEFPAQWDKYGKRAGFIRNVDIITNCDMCAVFWDGQSHGTKHDIDLCEEMGKPYEICYFENEEKKE